MTHHQGHVALGITGFLWHLVWPILAALVLGFLVCRRLQRYGLRWTWAFFGVPVSYLSWFVQWRVGLVLSLATIVAIRQGYLAHGECLQMGGEEAREKREAIGPMRWIWSQLRDRRAKATRLGTGSVALGTPNRGGLCEIPLGNHNGRHGLVLGATGSGKTVTQAAIAQAYIRAGRPAIVIDPKGDHQLRETLASTAHQMGVTMRTWEPGGAHAYNPIARGGPTEIVDKALAAHEWSEPHYELATQRLLGHTLATLKAADLWPPTLTDVVDHMDPERLDALASTVGGEAAERVSAYVDGLSPRAISDLGGGRDRLAVLAESGLGHLLDPKRSQAPEIDLYRALQEDEVLYFNLDSDRYPAAAKLLGSALLIDLVGLSAEVHCDGALLAIDEFAALAAPQVSRLFARARSSGISLLLATQSLADLRGARPDDASDTFTEQVLSNIEFAVAHRVSDPDSAERLARFAGTTPAWTFTERIDSRGNPLARGEGTRTRDREFVIEPDAFKRLGTGVAVLLDPRRRPPAQVIRVWGPQEAAS